MVCYNHFFKYAYCKNRFFRFNMSKASSGIDFLDISSAQSQLLRM
jgi:hypothetical protein